MKNTTILEPAELQRLLAQEGCQLIDVREPVEYSEEHIEGAVLMPLESLAQRREEIDSSRPIVVMCRSGMRGQKATARLEGLGFAGVRNLEGGILAWKSAGLPVVCPERRRLPLMQQVQLIIGLGVLSGSLLALLVNPWFALIPAFFGCGLTLAGSTGWCGLALLLAKMPWNQKAGGSTASNDSCSIEL